MAKFLILWLKPPDERIRVNSPDTIEPMTKGVEFQMKKSELINSYKEYLALLEDFQLSDAYNINVLEELAKAHTKATTKGIALTNFLSTYREKPTEEN